MPSRKQKPSEGEAQIPAEPMEAEAPSQAEIELEALHRELEAEKARSGEYKDGWQRERAEFFNYKRRIERDQAQEGQAALGNAIRRYLDIADDLERALKKSPKDGDGAAWAQGIELIYRKFVTAFQADGLKQIEAEGQMFDPALHEAISQEDSPDHTSGQVIAVVQPGYRLGERVLRPARVRVAR